MKIKNLIVLTIAFGCYYFLYSLGTTNKITSIASETSTESIKPNLLVNLSDRLAEYSNNNELLALLTDQEKTIWRSLENAFGISQESCRAKKAELQESYEQATKELQKINQELPPLKQATLAVAYDVLNDFNIDPTTLVILPFPDPYPASANDNSLYINEEFFDMLSPAAQKFCLAHELQHTINKDDSTSFVFEHVIKDTTEKDHNHPLNQLSRIQELRSDLHAAMHSQEYAIGYKEFFEIALEVIGDHDITSHPKNSLRLSYAQKILSLMQASTI